MLRFVRHSLGLVLLPMCVLLMGGCSNSPKMCKVTGSVRFQSRLVPNITVHFVPTEGPESIGTTDESGVYTLTHGKPKSEGAVRGTHKVYFTYRPRTPKEEIDLHAGKIELPSDVTTILDKYGKLETTPLSFEVNSDGQVIDIPLE